MRKIVLLSIRPDFAERILCGEKRYEFRRTLFRDGTVRKAIIYASSPVCRVVGEFDIENILSLPMHTLWRKTRQQSGISWQFFSEYFKGKSECHAIKVANPVRYREPVPLTEAVGLQCPPQSFAYVESTLHCRSKPEFDGTTPIPPRSTQPPPA
jgi:predicted transcriptional regulator